MPDYLCGGDVTGVLGHAKMERFFQPGGPITVSVEFCLEMARIFDEHYEGATALALGAGKTNHMGLVDTAAACGSDMMTATPEGCPAGQPGICSTTVYDNSGNQGPFYNGEAGVSVWFTTHPKTEAGYDEEEKAAYVQGECIDRNGYSSNEGWFYCLCDVQFLPPTPPAPPLPPLPPPPSPPPSPSSFASSFAAAAAARTASTAL